MLSLCRRWFLEPHPEQEAKYIHPFDQQLVDGHYGYERGGCYYKIFRRDAHIPLDNVKTDNNDYRLVQYIERQDGFVGIGKKSITKFQESTAEAKYGDYPAPGT